MKNLLILFTIVFSVGYWFTSVTAKEAPKLDEIELLMQRVQSHIKEASEVTQMARRTSQKMVEAKVEEKKELKEAVVVAESKVEAMEVKTEMLQAKMIGAGLDTSIIPVKVSGPAYDAFLNYVEEGGKEDFEYFRLYIWQQK